MVKKEWSKEWSVKKKKNQKNKNCQKQELSNRSIAKIS